MNCRASARCYIEYDPWELRVPYSRVVHDASYYSVIYKMVLPFTHILQYAATYGVTEVYAKEFGVEFPVEPEIEMEFGVRDDICAKWDWSIPNLVQTLMNSVKEAEELDLLEGTQQEVLDQIFEPWRNKKMRNYLQSKYPLLGVSDLNKQIVDALKAVKPQKKEKEAA